MNAVRLCDAFGWSYEEYRNLPKWFIYLSEQKRVIDNKHSQKSS